MTYEEMYPCRAQIIRTKAGRENAPLDEYRYPSDSLPLLASEQADAAVLL